MISLKQFVLSALHLGGFFLCAASGTLHLSAQPYSNPVGTALGGAGAISAQDVDAIASNPALMIPQIPLKTAFTTTTQSTSTALIFTLGAVGGVGGESALNLSEISTYFRRVDAKRRVLSDEELRTVSSRLDGSRIGARADATLLAAVLQTPVGAFALSASVHGDAGVKLPQGLGQLLQGYDAAQRLSITGLNALAYSYGNLQLGYANYIITPDVADSTSTLASLRVGGAVQYLVGYAFEEVSSARLDLAPIPVNDFPTTSYNIRANLDYTVRSAGTALLTRGQAPKDAASLLNAAAGSGFGVSLGAAASLRLPGSKRDAWKIAVSLTDIGGITWSSARFARVSFQDSIKSIVPLATDSTYLQRLRDTADRKQSVSRGLATRLHIGFAFDYGAYFDLPMPLVLNVQYTQGLSESGFNTTAPRLTLGMAWENRGWLPSVRTGVAVGGQEGILWSAGLGWNVEDAFLIDAAFVNLLPLLSSGSGAWLGGSLRLKGRIAW